MERGGGRGVGKSGDEEEEKRRKGCEHVEGKFEGEGEGGMFTWLILL